MHRHLKATVSPFLDWEAFTQAPLGLFLWEAFVTGHAKGETHTADAEIAVRCFTRHLPDITAANAIEETSVYSLIGAALLRTGWSTDLALQQVGVWCGVEPNGAPWRRKCTPTSAGDW